ncbi:autotransporter outer membrane beta-barrel domain-containing protein [Endomicrobium proavitum]|uniref:Autotransporter domain-containing protein n=1 Tax=Endomicrobium proavitum TaxID=1408281 RepID=A0A0G3WI87_9BACT|nr:autotransporter outer membrane beta-barrel domain-containing protein [Endomicrobium proavitum]AKL98401.1 exported protein of unknown function [Endomicrobium proavitum]
MCSQKQFLSFCKCLAVAAVFLFFAVFGIKPANADAFTFESLKNFLESASNTNISFSSANYAVAGAPYSITASSVAGSIKTLTFGYGNYTLDAELYIGRITNDKNLTLNFYAPNTDTVLTFTNFKTIDTVGGGVFRQNADAATTSNISFDGALGVKFIDNITMNFFDNFGGGGAIYNSAQGGNGAASFNFGGLAQFLGNSVNFDGSLVDNTTSNNLNYGGGGAILNTVSGSNSNASFTFGGLTEFTGNSSNFNGTWRINFLNAGHSVAAYAPGGAAIYNSVSGGSNISSFTFGGLTKFTGNSANFDGEWHINFIGSNNTLSIYGGGGAAIYNTIQGGKASFAFNDAAEFTGNSTSFNGILDIDYTSTMNTVHKNGRGGAAIYNTINNNGVASFTFGGLAKFNSNFAQGTGIDAYGGAIYNNAQSGNTSFAFAGFAEFSDNYTHATNSNAQGGAIYSYLNNNANISFAFNNSASFIRNSAKGIGSGYSGGYGGAIYNTLFNGAKSSFTFNSLASFEGNSINKGITAGGFGYGGAIYNNPFFSSNASFTFGDRAKFIGNYGLGSVRGGAIYSSSIDQSTSTFTFESPAEFTGNYVQGGNVFAGAIYSEGSFSNYGPSYYSSDIFVFEDSAEFTGNYAIGNYMSYGGAIAAVSNGSIIFNGTTRFANNYVAAGGLLEGVNAFGGAIYVGSAKITFNIAAGDSVLFSGNLASGAPNDIYLDLGASLIINSTGSVVMEGGILSHEMTGADNSIKVEKNGSGLWVLGGRNEIYGDVYLNGGALSFLKTYADKNTVKTVYKGDKLSVGVNAALDLSRNGLSEFVISNETASGWLDKVEVSSFAINGGSVYVDIKNDGKSDQIITVGAVLDDMQLYYRPRYGVYESGTIYDIVISTLQINTNGNYNVIIDSRALVFQNGSLSAQGMFSNDDKKFQIKLMNDATVRTTVVSSDFLSVDSVRSFNQKSVANALDVWTHRYIAGGGQDNAFTDMLQDVSFSAGAVIDQFTKEATAYFLSNILRQPGLDESSREIYGAIEQAGAWANFFGEINSIGDNDNSGKYENSAAGATVGYNIALNNNLVVGAFGKYRADSAKQAASKANINSFGGGLYAQTKTEVWDLKLLVNAMQNKYDISRNIDVAIYGGVAKSSFDGLTIGGDLEFGLKVNIAKYEGLTFRPFAGLQVAQVSYEDIKETGSSQLNSVIGGGSYSRTVARIGAGLERNLQKYKWYARADLRALVSANDGKIEQKLLDAGAAFDAFEVKGYKESILKAGIAVGGSVELSQIFSLFGGLQGLLGDEYVEGQVNAGLKIEFGGNAAAEIAKHTELSPISAQSFNKIDDDMNDMPDDLQNALR